MAEMAHVFIISNLAANGICFEIRGFSDSIKSVLIELLEKLIEFKVTGEKDNFDKAYHKFDKEYNNFFFGQPYSLANSRIG